MSHVIQESMCGVHHIFAIGGQVFYLHGKQRLSYTLDTYSIGDMDVGQQDR